MNEWEGPSRVPTIDLLGHTYWTISADHNLQNEANI